ncbi:Na+/H+ antiporter subunit G [Bradyrhizobium sp. USDA 10063]
MLIELVTSALVLIGGAFALLGSVGLARLPDLFTRLHGPTKATTLGVGAMVIGSLVHFNANGVFTLRELTIILFLFITAPVSAHMISKAALKESSRSRNADQNASGR